MKPHQFLYPILIAAVATLATFGTGCKEDKKEAAGVSLSPKSLSMAIGGEQYLTASVIPSDAENKSVSWLSHDNDIATVNAGVVKGIAAGETYVVVATEEGNFRDSCLVTVVGKKLLPSKITEAGKDFSYTYDYTYDNQNRLTEIRRNGYGQCKGCEGRWTTTITRNASGQVTEMETSYEYNDSNTSRTVYSYSYNGNRVTETRMYEKNNFETCCYELNDKGQCVHIYSISFEREYLEASFTYDAQGNCNEMESGLNPLASIVAYDNKAGIFSQVNTPSWVLLILMRKNLESISFLHHVNNVVLRNAADYVATFSSDYNESGYPTKVEVAFDDSGIYFDTTDYTIEYVDAK